MVFCFNGNRLPKVSYMGRNRTGEGFKHSSRVLQEYVFYLVIKGEMFLEEDGEKHVLQAGDLLVLEPNRRHAGVRESECDYFYIHCDQDCLSPMDLKTDEEAALLEQQRRLHRTADPFGDTLYREGRLYIQKRLHLDAQRMQTASAVLQRAIAATENRREQYKLHQSLAFMEILMQLSRQYAAVTLGGEKGEYGRGGVHVQALLEFLGKNYAKRLSSEEIAAHMGMNYDYLNRIFKQQLGMTIFRYVDMLRVNRAKELLQQGNLRSREIAEAVGYSDEYLFSKAFKRAEGYSPKRRK